MLVLFFGLVWALLAFFVLGFGPTLFLCSRRSLGFAFAVAPTVGFVLVTIVGTYLTLLQIPVSRWTGPLVVAGSVLTLATTLVLRTSFRSPASRRVERSMRWGIGGFILALALSVAPQLWGGLQFSVSRGNGSDSFNYVTAANYLDYEPFSWAAHVDPQTLVNRDQSYQRAKELLEQRWGTYMMLAFSSRVAQVPPYVFEYCFSLLCLLIAFGPAFLYARSLALRPAYAALTAGAICLGFWAQIILDTRAQSQLNSIPVVLFCMLLISRLRNRFAASGSWREYALLGLCAASLAFLYIEMMPLALLALLLFAASHIRSIRFAWPAFSGCLFAVILALLVISPQWMLLFTFASGQFAFAASAPISWHLAYYRWFYLNPLAGFWGFGPMESERGIFATAASIAVTLLGLAFTFLLVAAFINALGKGRAAARLAACMAVASLIQFSYLAIKGQLWAAGKALSFGYAFFILLFAGYCLARSKKLRLFAKGPWLKAATVCGLTFLIYQDVLGAARLRVAIRKDDYPNYIMEFGEYRRHSWDLRGFQRVINGQQGLTVWSYVSSAWLSEYLDFALAHQVNFVNIGANLDVELMHAKPQQMFQPPQYIITDRPIMGSSAAANIVARNPELTFVRSNPNGMTLLSVSNPTGMEKTEKGLLFWIGAEPAFVTLVSSRNSCADFSARVTFPEGSGSTEHMLTIARSGAAESRLTLHEGQAHWQVPIAGGFNQLSLASAAGAPNRVRVDSLVLEGKDCEAVPAALQSPTR